MKKLVAVLLSCILLVSSVPAFGFEDDEAVNIIADTFLVRPVGLVSIVFGAAVFLVSLPFAATSKSVDATADALIAQPARYTFSRPLGDFRQGGGGYRMTTAAEPSSAVDEATAVQK